ncbi:hypothetical protein ACWGMW_28420 [Streptomyces albidoflavus]
MTHQQWGPGRRVYGADHPGQGPRPGEACSSMSPVCPRRSGPTPRAGRT